MNWGGNICFVRKNFDRCRDLILKSKYFLRNKLFENLKQYVICQFSFRCVTNKNRQKIDILKKKTAGPVNLNAWAIKTAKLAIGEQ